MLNTNKDTEKDENLNLSDMINEYEEDSVLRTKIETLKAEKAQEEAQRLAAQEIKIEQTNEHSALPVDTTQNSSRIGSETVSENVFIDVDSSQDLPQSLDDGDKTLVIMDAKTKHSFDEREESILTYGNQEVDAEEITEEDIKEFLGDEEDKKPRKPIDPNKMNKIITYVIGGVISLCLLVGVGFGVKMVLDSFQGEDQSEPTKKPEVKDPVEKPEEKPVEKDPVDNPPQGNEEGNGNAIKIAELNGTVKAKQDQINELDAAKTTADEQLVKLDEELTTLKTKYDAANTAYSNVREEFLKVDTVFNNKTKNVALANEKVKNAETALANKTGTQKELDEANRLLAVANEEAEQARKDLEKIKEPLRVAEKAQQEAKTAYDAKEAEKKKKTEECDSYRSQISALQNEIKDLQEQLQSLQK